MATKKTTKKAATKKTAVKKAAAPKKAVEKVATKKVVAKKATVKKAAKKATKKAAKKAAPAKAPAPLTTIVAQTDVGWGNSVYLRGEGGGLSWEEGTLMDWVDGAWSWSTTSAKSGITFKFLMNDEVWSLGEDLSVAAGGTNISAPTF